MPLQILSTIDQSGSSRDSPVSMCGIIGYIGHRNAVSVLIQGLEHLEYRGYDSSGIACFDGSKKKLEVIKEKGKLAGLKQLLAGRDLSSKIGLGHTRWATHGEPSRANAHPHLDNNGKIALIHNGIIENYAALKEELEGKGYAFRSQTDTEVAVNLISHYARSMSLTEAMIHAVKRMEGYFAFVLIAQDEPDTIYAFKRSNPLVLGFGRDEMFVASDVSALLPYTNRVLYLEDDEYVVMTAQKAEIFSLKTRRPVRRPLIEIHWTIAEAQKGGYPHYMLKEIFEQPRVLEEIVQKHIGRNAKITFDGLEKKDDAQLRRIKKIYTVSCGTAYHAGLVGQYMLEKCARIPVESCISSEFRYEDPVLGPEDLVILITQSGETADTLAALRIAKQKKALTLAIVNVVGSTIARESDLVVYTHAGPEIGVASTKAYTAQLATLISLAFYFAALKKRLGEKELKALLSEFKRLPAAAEKVLAQAKAVSRCARKHYRRRNFLYIGRGYNYPTALEGALKLKEISYAHAHGYAAGELKHGPIALIDQDQPVICIAPAAKTYTKMLSNIQEIKARDGIVIAIGTEGDDKLAAQSDDFFFIPKVSEIFSPVLSVIPLQLFAYEISVLNGRDVDQPRNLAKSVTVE